MSVASRQSSGTEVLSVAIEIANVRHLRKLDQNFSLVEIIQELCLDLKLPYQDGQYALQLNLDESGTGSNKYILESNRGEVKNGSILKLVYSPSEMAKMIIHKIKTDSEEKGLGDEAIWALEKLQGLVSDPSFAKEFYLKDGVPIINRLIIDPELPAVQLGNCLITLDFVMQHMFTDVEDAIIERIVQFVVNEKIPGLNIIAPSLSILSKIVANGGNEYVDDAVGLPELIPHLWAQDNQLIQTSVLALMNAMARSKNKKVFTSMASKHMKETISNNVLNNYICPDSGLAKELYDYQTLILSFKEKKLNTFVKPTGRDLPNIRELSRIAAENEQQQIRHSIGSLFDDHAALQEPYMTQKILLPDKINKVHTGIRPNSSLSQSSVLDRTTNVAQALSSSDIFEPISRLTLDCMVYFARSYPKQYVRVLLAEEALWQPFPTTCQCLVKLIADVLGITKTKLRIKKYQPLMFREPAFIEEVFCRMFLQLGRTRQDMRARTTADQEKVIMVLQRQLIEVLTKQPGTLKILAQELRTFNYSTISEMWLKEMLEKDNKINQLSAIVELRETRKGEIIALIRQQRMRVLLKGAVFPKSSLRNQKLKKRNTFVILSSNQKSFHFHDCDEDGRTISDTSGKISLAEISTLLVSKKCPHVIKEAKTISKAESDLAFSLIPDLEPGSSFDFIAPDQLTFDYWTDAINVILCKDMKSKTMELELEKLLDMEVRLQLLDIVGIKIPKQPPLIPPEPNSYDFQINH